MSLEHIADVVVVPQLAYDLYGHVVVVLAVLERCVHGDNGRAEHGDVLRVEEPPPLAPDKVAALHAR